MVLSKTERIKRSHDSTSSLPVPSCFKQDLKAKLAEKASSVAAAASRMPTQINSEDNSEKEVPASSPESDVAWDEPDLNADADDDIWDTNEDNDESSSEGSDSDLASDEGEATDWGDDDLVDWSDETVEWLPPEKELLQVTSLASITDEKELHFSCDWEEYPKIDALPPSLFWFTHADPAYLRFVFNAFSDHLGLEEKCRCYVRQPKLFVGKIVRTQVITENKKAFTTLDEVFVYSKDLVPFGIPLTLNKTHFFLVEWDIDEGLPSRITPLLKKKKNEMKKKLNEQVMNVICCQPLANDINEYHYHMQNRDDTTDKKLSYFSPHHDRSSYESIVMRSNIKKPTCDREDGEDKFLRC